MQSNDNTKYGNHDVLFGYGRDNAGEQANGRSTLAAPANRVQGHQLHRHGILLHDTGLGPRIGCCRGTSVLRACKRRPRDRLTNAALHACILGHVKNKTPRVMWFSRMYTAPSCICARSNSLAPHSRHLAANSSPHLHTVPAPPR